MVRSGDLVGIGNTMFIVRLFVIDEQKGAVYVEGPNLSVRSLIQFDLIWHNWTRSVSIYGAYYVFRTFGLGIKSMLDFFLMLSIINIFF